MGSNECTKVRSQFKDGCEDDRGSWSVKGNVRRRERGNDMTYSLINPGGAATRCGGAFAEKDFAGWMNTLEQELYAVPAWKDLLTYRGISLFDAGYLRIYHDLLKKLRLAETGSLQHEPITTETDGLGSRTIRVARKLMTGELTASSALGIASSRVSRFVRMSLPAKSLPEFPNEKRALVVRAFPNTVPLPVLKSLRNDFKWNVLFAGWNRKLEKPVRELGIPYVHLEDLWRGRLHDLQMQHRDLVNEMLTQTDSDMLSHVVTRLSGLKFSADAGSLFRDTIVQARLYVDVYHDILGGFRPNVVILFSEISLPERTMAMVARRQGIPSVTIQHGLYIGYVYRYLATDKIIVWGDLPKRFWLDRVSSPDAVVSVGGIGYDEWKDANPGRDNGRTRPKVLFVGQNPAAFLSEEMHRRSILAVVEASRLLPEVDFVIKPHPGENPVAYQSILENSNTGSIELVTKGSIRPLLEECDLVVTVFSTSGVEAMLLNRPVLVLNLSAEPPLAPYLWAAALVTEAEALPGMISRILTDAPFRAELVEKGGRFVDEYLGSRDGKASYRAADVIQQMASSRTRGTA